MLQLAGGDWTAILSPSQGSALLALAWRGRPILAPVPAGHDPNLAFAGAFLMLPWTNRLDGGRLPVDGTVHQLPVTRPEDGTAIHGLARLRPWAVAEAGAARVLLTQRIAADDAAAGPYRYAARLDLTLGAEGLTLALALVNRAAVPLPYGCGWHPWFLRPTGTVLRCATTHRFQHDARGLPLAVAADEGLDGADAVLDRLDTHFAGWDGRATLERPDVHLHLAASGAWTTNLQVFAPGGAGVLCVEPVSHVPDSPNRPGFAAHGDLARLDPGAALTARLTLTARAP